MRTRRSPTLAALAAAVFLVLVPELAAAHPLGNFTINHYAGLRVSPDGVRLDIVIDYAEIPAFQERPKLDTDGDGDVSATEADAARASRCAELLGDLTLALDGETLALELEAAGLSFPPGAGGLATMRLVCESTAAFPVALSEPATLTFQDDS
jgi:hypothetical protein